MTTALERSLDNPPSSQRPTVVRGAVLRFAFAYWAMFCIPIISTQITGLDWIGEAIGSVWDAMVLWVGKNILAIPSENLAMQLERFVASNMLLVTRGFHWINEVPFNR